MLTSVQTSAPGGTPGPPDDAGRPPRSRATRLGIALLVAAILFALVRAVVVQAFVIPSGSMEQTLHVGDRVLVSRYSYRFGGSPSRGDVVVFDGAGVFEPATAPARSALAGAGRSVASAFGLPVGGSDYAKRVIGIAGDHVVCCDRSGAITVNGTALAEPYLYPGDVPSLTPFDIVVPPGRLWVMGDHRSDSADSRAHLNEATGGTVPVDRVVGRVVGVAWPASRWGLIPEPSYGTIAPASSASPARSAATAGAARSPARSSVEGTG